MQRLAAKKVCCSCAKSMCNHPLPHPWRPWETAIVKRGSQHLLRRPVGAHPKLLLEEKDNVVQREAADLDLLPFALFPELATRAVPPRCSNAGLRARAGDRRRRSRLSRGHIRRRLLASFCFQFALVVEALSPLSKTNATAGGAQISQPTAVDALLLIPRWLMTFCRTKMRVEMQTKMRPAKLLSHQGVAGSPKQCLRHA